MFHKTLKIFKSELSKLLNNSLVRNIGVVALITVGVKLVSFYKESLVASNFGLSLLLDTYYIAVLLPSFIQNVFIGALKSLFIPNYLAELKTNRSIASFQSFTALGIGTISIILSLVLVLFTEFFLELVFPGHDLVYYELIKKQFHVVLPCILLWGYSSFLGGLLDIKKKFFISSISGFFMPVTIIICLFFFKEYFGELVLAIGLLLGSIATFLYLLVVSIYYKNLSFGPVVINQNIRTMLAQYPPKVTSGLLVGMNGFIDQFFAASLIVGSISSINYGTKIPAFATGILMLSIGNVLLPHFSESVLKNQIKAFQQLFKILKTVFIPTTILIAIGIFLSEDIIRILFERGQFNAGDTYVVANIQKIALIYVPFFICTNIMVKFLTAINKNVSMAWISFGKLILNLILNFILIEYLGVYGLVLATTIVLVLSSFSYIIYTYFLYKKVLQKTI